MSTRNASRFVCSSLLTAACVLASAVVARGLEPVPSSSPTCASRDLQFVILLEQHGDAQDVAADRLADAFFTALQARAACAEGRAAEAIMIYDSIAFRPAQQAERRDQ